MADSDLLKTPYHTSKTRVSRISPYDGKPLHGYPTPEWGLPSDHVEVMYSRGLGIRELRDNLRKKNFLSPIDRSEYPEGGMLIFIGGTGSDRTFKSIWDETLREIDQKAAKKRRTVLLMPGEDDQRLLDTFPYHGARSADGYRDYGIKHGEYSRISLIPDVACFWGSGNEVSTVVLPGAPTMAGLNQVSTVMRKADILVSHYPAYSHLSSETDGQAESEIQGSLLVEEATKIWDPGLHVYGGTEQHGTIYAHGDKRTLSVGRRLGSPVVRWRRGDLEKGPIEGPGGYN